MAIRQPAVLPHRHPAARSGCLRRHLRNPLLLLILLAGQAFAGGPLVVTTNNDFGPGSLREHIITANAAAGPQQISFQVTGTIVPVTPLPAITGDLTIVGPGVQTLTLSGNDTHRLFTVVQGAHLTVVELTMADGLAFAFNDDQGRGGAIRNRGTLTLIKVVMRNNLGKDGGAVFTGVGAVTYIMDSELHNNTASDSGGALYVEQGQAIIANSRMHSNNGGFFGGAIAAARAASGNPALRGLVRITGSTLDDNRAEFEGGAIFNHGQQVLVIESTLSGNYVHAAGSTGGAIRMAGVTSGATGSLEMRNSTLSGNTVDDGHGTAIDNATFLTSADVMLAHVTIVGDSGDAYAINGPFAARNSLFADSGINCSPGSVTDQGGNLASDASCAGFTQTSLPALALAPLADNGGPTMTHALEPGSSAIDSIADCVDGNVVVEHDQRGVARPADGDGNGSAVCDAGAFEASFDVLFANGFEP